MRGTSPLFAFVSVVLLGGALAGCASRKTSMYDHEDFDESSTYSRSYAAPAVTACESARRALLSQGYVINKASTDVVDGRKSFQQTAEAHVEIEFHIVCAPDSADGTSSSVFVNAVQDRYTLKKTASSASLGVSILGSVSMPFGTSDDSMVKVGSETIAAPRFYNGFFGLLEQYLAPMQGRAAAQAAQAAEAAEAAAAASAAAARAQAPVPQPAGAIPASAIPGVQTAAPKAAAPQATDARPAELKPVEPAAAAAKAAEFKAAEFKAAESKAAESKAAESTVVESKAVESKAAESKAVESKAAESTAVESKAVESKAAESKAVESKAAESKAAELRSDVPASAPGSSPDALPSAPASTPAAQPSAPVADPVAPGAAPAPDVPTAN